MMKEFYGYLFDNTPTCDTMNTIPASLVNDYNLGTPGFVEAMFVPKTLVTITAFAVPAGPNQDSYLSSAESKLSANAKIDLKSYGFPKIFKLNENWGYGYTRY